MATEHSLRCLNCGAFKEYETQDGETVEVCPKGCVSARRVIPRREASQMEMTLGEKIRALRGERSMEECARAVGRSGAAWCLWETNKGLPREEVWPAIAKVLGTTVEKLFGKPNGEVKPIASKPIAANKSTAVVVAKVQSAIAQVIELEPEPPKPSTQTLRIAGLTIDLPGIGTIEELARQPDGSYRVVLTVRTTEAP